MILDNSNPKFYVPLLQGVIIFLWTLAVKGLTSLAVYISSSSKDSVFNDFPSRAIHLVVISASLFIYNSVVRLVTLFDKSERETYLERRDAEFTLKNELICILRSRDFIFENLTAIPLLS